ncbi:MAG TPA: enoyl-CoA hydratase-related protein [Myxococcota bacterium]|nr:enoyl-CoA hydratase-related protein [Myxococcota bacterium]
MELSHVRFEERDGIATLSFASPERRNPLSRDVMAELRDALRDVGTSKARGVVIASEGPVFCAGHDYADLVNRDLAGMRALLALCTEMMNAVQSIPQPVVARVQGLATGAGCQLVAACDLAVASEDAEFQTPGGAGGLFCTTPMVSVSRAIGRKRALELLFTGDKIDARTAADWGLVNRVVPANELVAATDALIRRATRGSAFSKGMGKQAYYAQIDLDQPKAYAYAVEVMASGAVAEDGQESIRAFVEKRRPRFSS